MTRILALFLATAALATAAAAEVSLGGKVHFDTPVADDVAAAGGRVSVDAPVAGNARLAGGHVEIGRDARIDGNAWLDSSSGLARQTPTQASAIATSQRAKKFRQPQ